MTVDLDDIRVGLLQSVKLLSDRSLLGLIGPLRKTFVFIHGKGIPVNDSEFGLIAA